MLLNKVKHPELLRINVGEAIRGAEGNIKQKEFSIIASSGQDMSGLGIPFVGCVPYCPFMPLPYLCE